MNFSVIVPTYNRSAFLRGALDSLVAQDFTEPFEIVVVDNNSSDDTQAVVHEYETRFPGKVRSVIEARQGLSFARNTGIRATHGDVIAFLDDDELAEPSWLSALAQAYREHPDAACIGGPMIPKLPTSLPRWFDPAVELYMDFLGSLNLGEATILLKYPATIYGGNFSVTRTRLNQVGLFRTDLGREGTDLLSGEDTEFCLRVERLGGRVYYCGAAKVAHLIPPTRLTKRFMRGRAYAGGRTLALLDAVPQTFLHLSAYTLKNALKCAAYTLMGMPSRAFACELVVWRVAGYMQQKLATPQRAHLVEPVNIGPDSSKI